MKIKKTVVFNLRNMKKAIFIYYAIVFASFLIVALCNCFRADYYNDITMSGVELMTSIFLFVCGLSSFRSDLLLSLQNGVSRKTILLGYLISSSIIAVIMGTVDSTFYTILNKTSFVKSGFMQLYEEFDCNIVVLFFITFAWYAFLYLCSTLFGYVIAALYYRMNKSLKLIVSIGVPGFFLIVLPFLDEYVVPDYEIWTRFIQLLSFMIGNNGTSDRPWNWMISCLLLSTIFAIFSYLLVRRADIKNK